MNLQGLQVLASKPCPFVGISREGERPLVLKREILSQLIDGLDEAQITVNSSLEIRSRTRWYTLKSIEERDTIEWRRSQWKWTKAQKQPKAPKLKLTAEERSRKHATEMLAKAQRKLDKSHEPSRPWNPVLADYDYLAYYRKDIALWYAQKPMRKKLAAVTARFGLKNGTMGFLRVSPKIYPEIESLTGRMQRYGQLSDTSRHPKDTQDQYLCHIYQYAGLQPKPGCFMRDYSTDRAERADEQAKDRQRYCDEMREYRNLQEMVNYWRSQAQEVARD